ncbi:MAG TPA: FAD-binding oxidoreductase [Ktedonobacterales bacterium]|jgi:glycine/D-amino acid oxidase-like deaminating enzyme
MQQAENNSLSFWQDDAGNQQRYRALEGAARVEVAIVGGGITGTAAALWLARAGRRVALLEQEVIAHGASGRNGGFVVAGTVQSYAQAIASYGRATARRLFAFSVANNATVRELVAELDAQGWQTGFRTCGCLRLADSPEELAQVQATGNLLVEDGWEVEPVSERDLPHRLQGHYLGGLFRPHDGEVQPARLVLGLAHLAAQAGASLYERTPALEISESRSGVSITTPLGTIQAETVIFAANAWMGRLLGGLPQTPPALASQVVTPTRGQVLATAPIGERLFEHTISAHHGYQYYRQLQDGRLIIGGWRDHAPDMDQRDPTQAPTAAVQGQLDRFLFDVLKLPADTPITHRWAGLMAFTPDSLPVVGWAPGSERILLCGGYTGHGNAMAVRCARVAADLACRQPNDEAELFRPERIL